MTPRRMEISLGVDHSVDPVGSPVPTPLMFRVMAPGPGGAGGEAVQVEPMKSK